VQARIPGVLDDPHVIDALAEDFGQGYPDRFRG
jgi:hypothetical protein